MNNFELEHILPWIFPKATLIFLLFVSSFVTSVTKCFCPSILLYLKTDNMNLFFSKSILKFLLNKFDVEHCVSLRYIACYFNAFTYCNMIADVVVFIMLHNYNTVFLCFCLYSLCCALGLYGWFIICYKFITTFC